MKTLHWFDKKVGIADKFSFENCLNLIIIPVESIDGPFSQDPANNVRIFKQFYQGF